MRNNENNITFNVRNITLCLENIKRHLTEKVKNITLVSIIIMLSFVNIINTSALNYSSDVNVNFTFNPTLSINLSSSDLTIDNLTPGTTSDSNTINISVATNAAYGYTLSATVGDSLHNNTNLTHTNGTNAFSGIAADSNLPSLTTDNTWGYSYKLSNSANWSNYSGLSNNENKTLLDTNSNSTINNIGANGVDSIDFKIAAKAGSTQASGVYTGVISFYATTKPTPMNLAESYFSHGKSRYKGYYAMQDMTIEICNDTEIIGEESQTQLIDKRDDKIYWATKLADGHCWMTQNLDLDLDSSKTYTHWDTDLGWTTIDEDAGWKPGMSTIEFDGANVPGWKYAAGPYSADPGDVYYYTSNSDLSDLQYDALQECLNAGHNDCVHYHAGNYYNFSATTASSGSGLVQYEKAPDSICPAGWRLPIATNPERNIEEFEKLINEYGIVSSPGYSAYSKDGFNKIRSNPLYFVRSGFIDVGNATLSNSGSGGFYASSVYYDNYTYVILIFNNSRINSKLSNANARRYSGHSVRCLAR